MDVSSIATAYTAFSEVPTGLAWGTESHSGQRNTSALVAQGLPGSGGRYCRPLATWWPPSHAARPPGAIGLPVGRGMTTARRSPASHALHCLRLPGKRNVRPVLEQSLQSDPLDERRSGQSGYLTLPGERGRMILHGFRGECGSMEPEISPLTVPVATRSRMEAFGLPFLREDKVGHPAWFSWAA